MDFEKINADDTLNQGRIKINNNYDAVNSQVSQLSESIIDISKGLNLIDDIVYGEYLSTSGVVTPNDNFGRSNLLNCKGINAVKVYTPLETSLCGFFDSEKNWIKYFNVNVGENTIEIPYNATYFMVSHNKENIKKMRIEMDLRIDDRKVIDGMLAMLNIVEETEDVKKNSLFKQGFYKIRENTITASEWYETYEFDVSYGDKIAYSGQTNANMLLYDYVRMIDANGNIVESKQNAIGLNNVSGTINIENSNVSKAVITLLKGNGTITRKFKKTKSDDNKYKKIVWFGTSIPEGQYNGVGTSYPEIIGKKLGIKVFNEAVGSSRVHGYRRKQYISDSNPFGFMPNGHFTNAAKSITDNAECKEWLINHWDDTTYFPNGRFATMTDADKETVRNWGYERKLDKYLTPDTFPDMFVFDYGRNDMWSSVDWTYDDNEPDSVYTSFQNAMNFLIRHILNYNNRAKIVIIGHYSNQERSALDPASVKDFPDKCALGQMEVAEYWELPICKLWELTGWSNKTIKVGNKDTSVLCSWLPDSLHPHSDTTGKATNHIADLLTPFIRDNL